MSATQLPLFTKLRLQYVTKPDSPTKLEQTVDKPSKLMLLCPQQYKLEKSVIVEKETDAISLKEAKRFVSFIGKYCKYNALATIRFLDHEKPTCGGLAYQLSPDESFDASAPSLVKIWIGNGKTYPRRDSYVPEITVTFYNIEEEILYVLAHEMRHIDQFWSTIRFVSGHPAELDAERFAVKVLDLWRREQVKQAKFESLTFQHAMT